ncbi:MAG: hypothetical protein C0501_27705 [Isosphaera sp.]|nr:hypothetical protein [Isosphaera sp.]
MPPRFRTGLAFLLATSPALAGTPRPPAEVAAEVDREIDAKLAAAKVPASPAAADAEFLRRAALDLTGKLPTPEKAAAFLDSSDPDKRGKLIDGLLADPAFGERFAAHWAELFVKRNDTAGKLNRGPFVAWLAAEFNRGTGWDRAVTEMLTAGPDNPASLFLLTSREKDIAPNRVAGTVGALFLGVQLQCAECHRHPVTKEWKREDFWAMAAFFSRTKVVDKSKDQNGLTAVQDVAESPRIFVPRGDPKKPPPPPGDFLPPGVLEIPDATDPQARVGRARAKVLGASEPAVLPEAGSYRVPFAAWVTAADNPYFAKAFANRVWGYFLARGFVNPLDDMHGGNPPSHPAALAVLTREFTAAGFDLKYLVRCVCLTKAYGRTSAVAAGNESDVTLFSRAPVKAVRGPTLLAMMDQVLGKPRGGIDPKVKPEKGAPKYVPTADLLDTAGYDESPDEFTSGVPQALRLMNAMLPGRTEAVGTLIAATGPEREKALKELGRTLMTTGSAVPPADRAAREKAVEWVYLATLSRRPTSAEAKAVGTFLDAHPTPAAGYDALLWVLLSSPEFVTNH